MFCTESCEHGCNATSSGKVIGHGNGSQMLINQHHHHHQQQQFNMCQAPLSVQQFNSEVSPPRVGMCLVTECPEGLSIDCNVPLPSSFNLEEYKKQMICSCSPQFNGGYVDGFPSTQSGTTTSSCNPNPHQSPAYNYPCQSCTIGGYDSQPAPQTPVYPLPNPSIANRQEAPPTPVPTVMPQIFYLAAPTLDGSLYPTNQQPVYLCSLIPVPPSWNLMKPVVKPQQLPQQQLVTSPAQDSQLPTQQLARNDLPFQRLLAELRREREKSYSELQVPTPLAFQLYAPSAAYSDQGSTACPGKREDPDPLGDPLTTPLQPATPIPPAPPTTSSSSVRLTRNRSASPKRSRSYVRNKDLWTNSSAAPSGHAPYSSAAQHGGGNVCMKCGNCWHCPRCSCSNYFWHPGLVRPPPRDNR
ncbi:putative uncharacterized protein DDB_G0290521 [Drosophila ficusphila]|uniref:putative uncharacterized protein DDB_G0290521 n=1 Tax=Drosophila ficusphila TaxID=30025 RepID=UPI0007E6061C|nr:putative uncharacterized protein DDB_G0290521 [Drosophila ficusphila]